MNSSDLWLQGLWRDNPALVKLLGLCPLLAVSNSFTNAFALSIATLITLVLSNILIASFRHHLEHEIRLPIYVLIIATAVTCIELLMQAWLPDLHTSLGIFLPLIVTNCLIIGRAEAFASRSSIPSSFIDAMAMGVGFAWVLVLLGSARELLGSGTLFSDISHLLGDKTNDWSITLLAEKYSILIAILPPGAFILLGLLLALKNLIDQTRSDVT